MALVVNTNIAALNSQRNLGISHSRLGRSIERLSSGLRINRAADDPAGIAIAAKFATQVRGLNQAVRNVNNAIALAQTAEGGINTVTDILHRLRELAVQASSDDNTPADRANLASEADQLVAELTRTVNTTEYNTMPLLDGGFVSKYFQIGSNYGQNISFTIADTRGRSLGGRAEFSADIADGVLTSLNANFGAGEFKINTYGVATTNASDDQYSVLDISSTQIDSADLQIDALTGTTGIGITGTTTTVELGAVLSQIADGVTAVSLFTDLDEAGEAGSYVGTNTTLATDVAVLAKQIASHALVSVNVSYIFSLLADELSGAVHSVADYASVGGLADLQDYLASNIMYQNTTNIASAIYAILVSINTVSANLLFADLTGTESYFDDAFHTANGFANAVTSFGHLEAEWFNGDLMASADDLYTVAVNSGATVSLQLTFTIEGVEVDVFEYNATITNSVENNGVSYNSNLALDRLNTQVTAGSTLAADIVSAIVNNDALTALNITARVINDSAWVIERTGGGDLQTLISIYVDFQGGGVDAENAHIVDSALFAIVGTQSLMVDIASVIGNGGDITSAGLAPTAYNGESSAIAKAVAINAVKSNSGVLATAQANVVTGAISVGGGTIDSGDIYINGVDIGTLVIEANDSTGALVTAINNVSSDTGVTATTDSDSKLVLTAADGRNITITTDLITDATTTLGLDATYFTGTSAIFRSSVRLNDDEGFNLAGTLGDLYDTGTTAAQNIVKTTDPTKSTAADVTTYNMAGITIDTRDGAQAAILTIDAALDDVNGIRGDLGAMQNRLQFAVANLEVASENMSASESRIRDADFAYEVSQFTRNQILVQAGTAMLAQANTIPQIALQLLG